MTIDGVSGLQAAHQQFQIQVALAAKAMKVARNQGEAIVSLIQEAAELMEDSVAGMAEDIGRSIDTWA